VTAAQGPNGEVYKVTAAGTETILHKFPGGSVGANPRAGEAGRGVQADAVRVR